MIPTPIPFFDDNRTGQSFEDQILSLLKSWGIPCGRNPYTGTEDLRRGDYDIWFEQSGKLFWLECKLDRKSEETGRFCIELEALHHSKSPLFVYGLPENGKLYIHSFVASELEKLTTAQILKHSGRYWRYPRLQVGDQPNNVGVLVPKEALKTVGRPFEQAIRLLTQAKAA